MSSDNRLSTPYRLLEFARLVREVVGPEYDRQTILERALSAGLDFFAGQMAWMTTERDNLFVLSSLASVKTGPKEEIRVPSSRATRRFLGFDGPIRWDFKAESVEQLRDALPEGMVMAVPVQVEDHKVATLCVLGGQQGIPYSDDDLALWSEVGRIVETACTNLGIFHSVKEGQRLWQEIFDCITDAIIVQNAESVILRANLGASRLAGIDLKRMQGKRADELFPIPDTEKSDPFRRVIDSGEGSSFEVMHGGRPHLVSVFAIEVPGQEGQRACVQIRKDISDLKRLQNQLYDTEKLLAVGRLVGGVAHEINNPLTGVIGYSELLLRKKKEDEPGHREMKKILESALRCKSIVENLLAFSRQKPQERQRVNVNDILENTLQLRSYWLRHGGVEVTRHLGELPLVEADPQLIQQVFMNLIENAEESIARNRGKDGGAITIETFHADGRVLISITDNGAGISGETLSKVFEPFFTTKEVGKGAGLGLSSAYGIIRDHGGDIRVQSRAGEGATFIVELPKG